MKNAHKSKMCIWGISNTQKTIKNKKQWPKLLKPYSFWVNANYAYLLIYLCYLWNFEQAFGWGPERKSLWSKCIGEICVMVVYIKIIFLRLILNWRSLCKLQETLRIEGSKNTTVIFYILEGNILGYASYIKINPMLLHVKNFSTYI